MMGIDDAGVSSQQRQSGALTELLGPLIMLTCIENNLRRVGPQQNPSRVPHIVQPRTSAFDHSSDPQMLPNIYMKLYPFGVGGLQDFVNSPYRSAPKPLKHIQANLLFHDRRFAKNETWVFTVFDHRQRAQARQRSRLRMSRSSTAREQHAIAALDANQLREILQAIERGTDHGNHPELDAILKHCHWITRGLVGSREARLYSRKRLFAYASFGWLETLSREYQTNSEIQVPQPGGIQSTLLIDMLPS